MNSVFSKIVAREIPAYVVAEDDKCIAFLDVNPLAEGHVLAVPKQEVDYIFDLDEEIYKHLMVFARKVAKGLKNAVECKRIGVAVIGLEVPHAHIHLIPLKSEQDIHFGRPKLQIEEARMRELAEKIRDAIR